MARWLSQSSKLVDGGAESASVGSTPTPSRLECGRVVAWSCGRDCGRLTTRLNDHATTRRLRLAMEISLFQADEPLRFERIVLYPYPDLKRIWTRAWLTPAQDEKPNIEIVILNPNGTENTSVFLLAHGEQKLDTTLHLRNPQPDATYHVIAILSLGMTEKPTVIDRQEFDLLLQFRNPDAREPGFGMGVDWDEFRQGRGQE